MNQIEQPINLRRYLPGPDAWGHHLGATVHEQLRAYVEMQPHRPIFAISLRDVAHTDVSFPRRAVVELAVQFRMQRGFYLMDVEDEDLLENWDAAALRCQQPLFVWAHGIPRLLGPATGEGTRTTLSHVLSTGTVTAGEVARSLDIKVQNASNKLKQLWEEGYILRREQMAPTGGVEFAYVRIG